MAEPPPAPPAPPPPPPPPVVVLKEVEGAPPEVTAPDEKRTSLMESIRSSGGFGRANLKSTREFKTPKRKGPVGRSELAGNLNAMLGGGRGGRGGRGIGIPMGGLRGRGMPPRR